jgi:hypothetical protein
MSATHKQAWHGSYRQGETAVALAHELNVRRTTVSDILKKGWRKATG